MARAMLSEPAILVADEPTQGVDVGARAEIYRILREVSAGGVPVVLTSSDALELEGLCDRVIVMSRGQAVATLEGDAVNEERIIHAAVSATAHTAERARHAEQLVEGRALHRGRLRPGRHPRGGDPRPRDLRPSENSRYLSDFNITSVMFACAALGFISLGQTFALLLGGIDLSVGPLAGFLVVLASFFILDGKSPAIWVLGLGLMILARDRRRPGERCAHPLRAFTPVAATLVTYIALGGLAFTLRDAPDGYIAASVTEFISTKVGPVPIAFVVFVVGGPGARAGAAEVGVRPAVARGRVGRGVGAPCRRAGQQTALLGYLCGSLLTLCGAIVLLAQLGVGDPGQGTGYTLTSITAVVLGGTSLLGGRGTFIGTLMGAGLSVQVLNATVFLT